MSPSIVCRVELSILQEKFGPLLERMLSGCVSDDADFGLVEESIGEFIASARPLLVSSGLRTCLSGCRRDYVCRACGVYLTGWGKRDRRIVTNQGESVISVPRYRCRQCGLDCCPVLESNGLTDSQYTFGAKERIVEEATESAYNRVSQDLPGLGIHVSAKEVDRIVTEVAEWHSEEQAGDTALAFESEPSERRCLYDWRGWERQTWAQISVDAGKVRSPERGEDGKLKWFDGRSGLIRPLSGDAKALTFHSAGVMETWDPLYETLYAVWGNRPKWVEHLVFIADGGNGIWERARLYFSDAIHILDAYHASEHVGSGADAIWGQGSRQAKEYKKHALSWLKQEGGPRKILRRFVAALRSEQIQDEPELRKQIAYLYGHRHRMQYAKWLEMGLPIGSGAMESAIKQVCVARLRQPGMMWTRAGADAMLRLRSANLSATLPNLIERRRSAAKMALKAYRETEKYRLAA